MDSMLKVLLCFALFSSIAVLWLLVIGLYKKAFIDTTVNVQCSSGDSEVMSLTTNFAKGESEESKKAKLASLWDRIQYRRDENHEKWLQLKAAAIAENEKKNPEDLKLHSLADAGVRAKVSKSGNDTHVEVG